MSDDTPRAAPLEIRLEFQKLVDLAKRSPSGLGLPEPLYAQFGGANVAFEGDGWEQLQNVTRLLTEHSIRDGGPSRQAAQKAIVESCGKALDENFEAGLAELIRFAEEPLTEHTVIEPIRILIDHSPIRVGACEIHAAGDTIPAVQEDAGLSRFLLEDTPVPVLTTRVWARDHDSALQRGRDRFDESRAFLMLVARPYNAAEAAFGVVDAEGNATFSRSGTERFILQGVGGVYEMPLGYRGLENALSQEPEERSDWARRVIAAMRWHRIAQISNWLSPRVAAAFSALECLLLDGERTRSNKRDPLANTLGPMVRVKGLGREELEMWVKEIYGNRNGIVHGGDRYLADIDTQRLVDVTEAMVRWGSHHLDADHDHHSETRACSTREEALGLVP